MEGGGEQPQMTTELTKTSQSREAASQRLIPFGFVSLSSSILAHCVCDFKQGAKPQLRGLCGANSIPFLVHSNKPHSKGINPRKSAVLTPGLGTYVSGKETHQGDTAENIPGHSPVQTLFIQILLRQQGKKFFFFLPLQMLLLKPEPWLICHSIALPPFSLHGSCDRKSSRSINKAFRLINLLTLALPSSRKHSVCLEAEFFPLIPQRLSLGWFRQ